MIGRADIEGSKSNVAMNAWLPQASYPCGNFSDTSSFKFRSTSLLLTTLTLKIAKYCSSPLLFIAATIHRRYCSSRLLFIAATVRRGYCSSRLLFIAATVHHGTVHHDTVHRRYCSSQLLFITVLFIVDTVHRGTVCGSLQQRELLRSLAPSSLPYNPIRPQRIRKNPKNLTTSKVIDHTAVTVVDGKDVVVATVTHPAVGTTITVDVDPIPAVVEGEDDVVFPNHNTRPNEYVIDVVLKGRGCGHYNSSGRGNHYNRGCRPNSGRGRGRGRCEGIELKDKDKKWSRDQYCIRLNKSLYGLKQSGRMWYNRLSDYLVREGYKNDPISPCIFIKKFANKGFVIIAVYVDDLNILGTSGEIAQTVEYLKKEFEMKDLGKTKFCLGLQLEYVNNGILVHQKAYTEKVLKRFNMDQAHPLSSPMVVRSLGLDSDSFDPKKDEEEVLGPEVPYLSAIGALMYLASHTRPDICFAVNLLCLNLVHDQPKGTGKAVFFKTQLLQHQRPSYLKTTQPVIAQLKDSYIKGDRTKHILPKFFFTHDLQRDGEVRVMCRPSQTPHLTMSSARIDPPKRALGPKTGVVPRLRLTDRIPLVRTSSELTVRRPGKAPERAVPSPSPGRHAATRSRRGSSSSSPPTADGFGTGTPEPSPQSQSFSLSYGSILPTSLAYIVPSTRGCSPWRPDAVMSTTGRERHSVLRIFKGRRGRTGHHATCGALPAAGPYLRLSRFQDLHRRPLRPGSRPRFYSDRRALLLIEAWLLPRRPGIGRALQRHPFSGLVDSADERFARQYRCGPPPEFPLASPRSGIVHHLSGPDRHAHTRTLLRRSRSVGGAPARDPANQLPCALRVYSPVDSHTCQTPWSVFQDGSNGEPTGRRPEHADAEARRRCRNPRRSTPRIDRRTGLLRSASDRDASPAPIRFPPDNFKHSLTLFSKSFSSLPRGTCSLSVSRPYLALDGIYRPIGAAFPNNPTRRQRLVVRQGPGTTGLSPSLAPLSRELRPGPSLRTLLQTTIRTPKTSDFQAGLFPVRSPLLRESLTLGHLQLPDRSDRQYQMDHVHHRMSGRSRRPWLGFRPTACGNTRETSFRPASAKEYRGRRFVTPRQTCPRPEGLGRNLRSKTRWFTGFCNSHQVSHFATFFIDARAEISVAESRFRLYIAAQHPRTHRLRGGECQPFVCLFLDTFRRYAKPRIRRARDRLRNRPTESGDRWFAGRSVLDRFSGLLATSRAANHPRRRDPNTSPDHSIGRSDGRQIAPPTKNGHAPPPIESRKSSQSVNPYYVWTCNSAGGTTRPIKTRSVSPTEGTSRPVHTKGGPADPSQGRMSFGGTESLRVTVYNFSASEISTGNLFTNANKATNAMSRVRYATQAPDPIIERNIAREVTEKDRCAKDTHETGSLVSLPADIHFPSKDGCQEHPQKFKAARCRCPWATLTPCSTRDSLGGSMLSNEARPSNLGGWNRCPWGHLGISGAFRIYRHPRPRRIHVSPCHDTPILFGDGVKRCPWGHLGIPCAFPIYRHPKASKNPCHPTHDTPILRDHSAIFVRELLKKLKNCDKTDRRKSRRKNFPAIIPAVGRSDTRLALNENPKNPNPKIAVTIHRRHYSSATLFIGDTVHRRYCSSRLLFIAATVHRRYCSSRLLFIAATVHRRYCSSPLLYHLAATVHRRTVHRRYCSSPLLFITVLFIVDTVSSQLLVHHGTVHRRHCHRGTVGGSLQQRELLRSLAPSSLPYNPIRPQRIRKNPKNLTTSKVIDHTAVTVVDGKDVVVATITHPAVGTTITVDVDPIPAVVEGEDDVVFPNHNTRPNEYAIDMEWETIGQRYVGLPNIVVTSIKRV
ncbi:Reverse transcriptase RNA-dependent DNA polymerase [Arabidopsis suecica]|uniref:Reverse transcriptase RNA-dependent DNA polymerase n=1 Tax=Arabidopsis suecica TaxID=45249 RepID=A0A8T1X8Z5_ARASU|nr:Reverse transcriptase RNA-dependent DNA polymerase [Arabidopsis suecica]